MDYKPKPRLLDQVRDTIRRKHYSLRTERAYVQWVKRFIVHQGRRHPLDMGGEEVTSFLSDLAVSRHVSASTQNQALSALLFLYKEVLGVDLPWLDHVERAKKSRRLPTVLTQVEVRALLSHVEGTPALMARLMYGTGMRLMECCRLRVKGLDFARREAIVRSGRGGRDRMTMIPQSLVEPLRDHLGTARQWFTEDRGRDLLPVELPNALGRKNPNLGTTWA